MGSRTVPEGPYWNKDGFIDWLDENEIEWGLCSPRAPDCAEHFRVGNTLVGPGDRVTKKGKVRAA